MINILIVDDQKHIQDGLQMMLRQFPLQLANIYCAGNGIEALDVLRQTSIQLVITDIRMPDMDGLTLMAQTKEERIKVDYLIISGYSDFAYAQRAIELGAKNYLLKPVKRDDLQAVIEHVMQDISTQQALSRNLKQLSHRARETERKELRLFMQGATNDDTWIARTQEQHPELWNSYRLCLLREERRISQLGAISAHGLESIAYRVYGREHCICLQHRPHLVLAIGATAEPSALSEALHDHQVGMITIMSDIQHGLRTLPESYTQLLELFHHSYLFPDQPYMLSTHISGLEQQWQLPYEKLYTLFQSMGTNNSSHITDAISMMFHKDVLQRYHIRYTEQLIQAIVQMLEEHERVIRPYLGEETLDIDSLKRLYDYPSIRDYIQALQQQLLRLNEFYYEFKCSYRNTQDLNEAIRYIHENYHKPLDLAIVSNHVSLNYSYFSNVFKKNIGKGFAEYVRDVRMDKARRLLAETEYKIIDIATMVGYESYKSFTRAFRECMDMQPTTYRQHMRRKYKREGKYQGATS